MNTAFQLDDDYPIEIKLKNVERLERCFHELMRDALFRRLTFMISGHYSSVEAKELANNGLFNCFVNLGSRSMYKVACTYCKFTYENSNNPLMIDWFNMYKIKMEHAGTSPVCNMIWPNDPILLSNTIPNIPFHDVYEQMGLNKVNKGFFSYIKMEYITEHLFLPNKTSVPEPHHRRRQCIICYSGMRDVFLSCGHVIVCCICLTKLPTKDEHVLCPMCKEPIRYFSKATLPNVPMFIDF
jgi:hypothetical protein